MTNQQINALLGCEDVSGGMMILSFFCAPVGWYIWYKWDKSLAELSQRNGKPYGCSFILWIIVSAIAGVGSLVMEFQVQETLNGFYGD